MLKTKNLSHTCANRKDVGLYITRTHPYLQTIKGFTVLSSFPKAVCCWYMYLSNSTQRGYFNYCQLQLLNMFNTMFDYLVSWS